MKFKIRINSCLLQFFDFNPKQYKSQKKLLEISLLLIQSSIRAKKKIFLYFKSKQYKCQKINKNCTNTAKVGLTQFEPTFMYAGCECTQVIINRAKICIPQYGHKQERVSWLIFLPICIWIFIHKPFTLNFFSHVE